MQGKQAKIVSPTQERVAYPLAAGMRPRSADAGETGSFCPTKSELVSSFAIFLSRYNILR
jgi:hypothetical protein